ncbi:hypothetical protein K438DRAFT_1852205, partial [Mycena galopus ATCC 62051]
TRYVVETLLIPKQHATSDTCTMDEEEGVLGFTEERGLITLRWIHTHPSCFMSSVSFQCCSPSLLQSCVRPSQIQLRHLPPHRPPGAADCPEVHRQAGVPPHLDVPIYTDADKGHVQMRDAALEIMDLR